jgi:hypothetical protein
MGTGLLLLLLAVASIVAGPGKTQPGALGLELLDGLLGVPGGVTPLPLARDSPIALTNSFTDTPISSGGKLSLPGTIGGVLLNKIYR